MCKELSIGLTLLSSTDEPFVVSPTSPTDKLPSNSTKVDNKGNVLGRFEMDCTVYWNLTDATTFDVSDNEVKCISNWNAPNGIVKATKLNPLSSVSSKPANGNANKSPAVCNIPVAPPRKSSPNFSQLRSQSLDNHEPPLRTSNSWNKTTAPSLSTQAAPWTNGHRKCNKTSSLDNAMPHHDPFDASWASLATRNQESNIPPKSTNPFISTSAVKAFEVKM